MLVFLILLDLSWLLHYRHLEQLFFIPHLLLLRCSSQIGIEYLLAWDAKGEGEVEDQIPQLLVLLAVAEYCLYTSWSRESRILPVALLYYEELFARALLHVMELDQVTVLLETLEGKQDKVGLWWWKLLSVGVSLGVRVLNVELHTLRMDHVAVTANRLRRL